MSPQEAREVLSGLRRYQQDPVGWVREILGKDPWSMQERILRSVAQNKRTAVRSCHGVGKTAVAAMVALWWLFCHPDSIVVTTAPSWPQVKNLLWREIRAAHAANKRAHPPGLGGECRLTGLEVSTNWYAIGLSTNESERFQGFHSPYILLIVDEASGVDQIIFTASEGFFTSSGSRSLLIGNPTQLSGEFYQAFRSPLYEKIHISAYDSPNVTGEGDRPYLVTREWIEEHRLLWGEGSPLWASRVLGDFPDQAEDALIPLTWIERAMDRETEPLAEGEERPPLILGVDVARQGNDTSVIGVRHGDHLERLLKFRKLDTMSLCGWVIDTYRQEGGRPGRTGHGDQIRIDADGLGAGVCDRLHEQGYPVVEMQGGSKPRDDEHFLNARAEWYWGLRERLDPGQGSKAVLPKDDALLGQLAALKHKMTSRGQVQIESKDDLRRRGLSSPDEADAVMYCFAGIHQPRSALVVPQEGGRPVVPETIDGMQAGVAVRSNRGGLPIPLAQRRPGSRQVRCPTCKEVLSIHQGTRWFCRQHGWHEPQR